MELSEYWQAIQENVCARCVDSDGAGNCRLDSSVECPLLKYLPLIVNAVHRVTSDRVDDYVVELRDIVCAQCRHQSPDGKCALRSQVDCALDRYFPLVIEAIERVDDRCPA